MSKEDDLLPIGDVARMLQVNVATVRRWEDAGTIQAIRLPSGHRRFRRGDIDALLNTRSA